MKIGVIGLGAMGLPMARNLLKAGHQVTVFNRTRARAEELGTEGAIIAGAPVDLGLNEIVISMLGDDAALAEVALNDRRFIPSLGERMVHVSMSTISLDLARRLTAAHRAAGQTYVSAPVFGRPDAAAAARLTIIAAGPADAVERCQPAFEAIGQRVFVVGEEPASANLIKITGNFMLAATLETLAEAFALVRSHGVPPAQFLEIMTSTLFSSPVHKNYGSIMAEERFTPPGFKLPLGLKDVRLALAAADEHLVPLPTASLVRDQLLSAMARGYEEMDWAVLARVIAENAGLSSPPA